MGNEERSDSQRVPDWLEASRSDTALQWAKINEDRRQSKMVCERSLELIEKSRAAIESSRKRLRVQEIAHSDELI